MKLKLRSDLYDVGSVSMVRLRVVPEILCTQNSVKITQIRLKTRKEWSSKKCKEDARKRKRLLTI